MRVWVARAIAVSADVIQIALFPIFAEGILSPVPVNAVMDVVVCIALTLLVGWHIAFAPSFIVEQLPLADLAPTWTVAIFLATGGRHFSLGRKFSKLIGSDSAAGPAPWQNWYNQLAKPRWTPSPHVIGWIWTVLYPIIFTTFGYLFVQAFRGKVPWPMMVPFGINLVANLLFTPILFRLKNLKLALFDILIVVGSLIWAMAIAWPLHPWIVLAQIPYLIWVLIATYLQFRIVRLNVRTTP